MTEQNLTQLTTVALLVTGAAMLRVAYIIFMYGDHTQTKTTINAWTTTMLGVALIVYAAATTT